MNISLYDTLSRTKRTVEPLQAGQIKLYTCGPTVYHYYHVGNLRNAVFNDTLRRVLELSDYKVKHLMNITDVGHLTSDEDAGDDKLQNRAKEEGKTVWEVADFYTEAFMNDMERLHVLKPTKYVRATEAIDQQIAMVKTLVEKGFAYQADQAIYFDVSKLDDYGKLTGQTLGQKEVGARSEVVTDPQKRNPQDFALWFFTVGHFKDHQMKWASPWGEGFPGWHLECSAIIERELGDTIDIHTGGVDHIGTHHTNEIAQSEAAHGGKPLANIWLHTEFLMVDGKKMSKSLRNTFTLQDVIDKGFAPEALRLLYLQSHYRTLQNFTWEALESAQRFYEAITEWVDMRFQSKQLMSDTHFEKYWKPMLEAANNDLGTPQALALLGGLVQEGMTQDHYPTVDQLEQLDHLFGFNLADRDSIAAKDQELIRQRQTARESKDFKKSDELRQTLREHDIVVEDTAAGPRWRRPRKEER